MERQGLFSHLALHVCVSRSGLGVCCEWFHLMHDIKHSMCKLQIVWDVDDCGVPLHVHFRRGVALVGKFDY